MARCTSTVSSGPVAHKTRNAVRGCSEDVDSQSAALEARRWTRRPSRCATPPLSAGQTHFVRRAAPLHDTATTRRDALRRASLCPIESPNSGALCCLARNTQSVCIPNGRLHPARGDSAAASSVYHLEQRCGRCAGWDGTVRRAGRISNKNARNPRWIRLLCSR